MTILEPRLVCSDQQIVRVWRFQLKYVKHDEMSHYK